MQESLPVDGSLVFSYMRATVYGEWPEWAKCTCTRGGIDTGHKAPYARCQTDDSKCGVFEKRRTHGGELSLRIASTRWHRVTAQRALEAGFIVKITASLCDFHRL